MEEEAKQKLAWTFSWISLGLFLSSKESLRYTALWRFDEKPIALVIVIGILFAATFLSIMYMAKNRGYGRTTPSRSSLPLSYWGLCKQPAWLCIFSVQRALPSFALL